MRWAYVVAAIIPVIMGMITTLSIMSIILGPPTISFGGGEPTLIIDSASITNVGKNNKALILDVHNPGSGKVYIIGIKINGKDVENGPSFQNPLVVEGGQSTEISYLVGDVKPVKNKYNITVLFVPETTQSITSTYVIIPARR